MFDKFLRGVGNTAASVVGFARGLVEGSILAGLAYAAVYITDYDFGILGVNEEFAPLLIGAAVLGIRSLEGLADQIDPTK